jgi:hypothetical protein
MTMPSIRVSPEAYSGLKKMIEASYANTISAVIERFLKEEGVMPLEQKSLENIRFEEEEGQEIEGEEVRRMHSFNESEEEEIIKELGGKALNYLTQRDGMRALFSKFNGDKQKITRAYAYMDENLYVPRKNNTHNFSSRYYAEALYNDGIKKGWLK